MIFFFFFNASQKGIITLVFNVSMGSSGAKRECHCKKMSSVGEATNSIHADLRSYQ